MSGDSRGQVAITQAHELDRLASGNMLENDTQLWKAGADIGQAFIDKDFLTIEDVDLDSGGFTMYLQDKPMFLHCLEYGTEFGQVGNPCVGVSGCAGVLKFGTMNEFGFTGSPDFIDAGIVGKV